jgi:hypothetical protein
MITRLPNGLRYLRWGGDEKAVQPEKAQAWKMLENGVESPASGAHFVRWHFTKEYTHCSFLVLPLFVQSIQALLVAFFICSILLPFYRPLQHREAVLRYLIKYCKSLFQTVRQQLF